MKRLLRKIMTMLERQPKSLSVYIFFFIVCGAVFLAIFAQDISSRSTIIQQNQSSGTKLYPYYGYLGVPSSVDKKHPRGSLGSDFSQVYYAAKAVKHGESPYTTKNPAFKDGSGRPPNYPPFTNWFYGTISDLPYAESLLIQNYGTFLIFFCVTSFSMIRSGTKRYIVPLLLIYISLYWYTTLGYAHFERGQFDLWTASFYTLIFTYIYLPGKEKFSPVLAGVCGAIKWSSFPFLGTFSLLCLAGSSKPKRVGVVLIWAVVTASVALLYSQINLYVESLKVYEFNAPVMGISFEQLFSKKVAKSIQIVSVMLVLAVFFIRTNRDTRNSTLKSISLPFALAMAIQGMCYGTISYEYRVVSLLGLIPALFVWLEREKGVSQSVKLLTATIFGLFLVLAFRTFHFWVFDYPTMQPVLMTICYLCASIVFLIISFGLIWSGGFSNTTRIAAPSQIS